MEAYVYSISCKQNGKRYVGSTTTTVKNRYQGHLSASIKGKRSHLPLYQDMRAFGIDSFTVELIETVPVEQKNQREQFWINELNCIENGYNTRFAIEKMPFKDYHHEWSAKPIVCECGATIKTGSKLVHTRSKKHRRAMEQMRSLAPVL